MDAMDAMNAMEAIASPELSTAPCPDELPDPEPDIFFDPGALLAFYAPDPDDDDGGDDDYESKRLRNLRANEALLAQLGIKPIASSTADDGTPPPKAGGLNFHPSELSTRTPQRSKPPRKRMRFAEDGTTTQNPVPGMTLEIAYVDVPILRQRARAEYRHVADMPVKCATPEPVSESDEEEEEEEEEEEPPKASPVRKRGVPTGEGIGPDSHGTSCHQCRRKTIEEKMRCRNHENGSVCPLFYCKRCLERRYGIEFDPESRTFKCPRCQGICNCSICLRLNGLGDLLRTTGKGQRFLSLSHMLRYPDGTVKYQSVADYIFAVKGDDARAPGGLHAGIGASKVKLRQSDGSPATPEGKGRKERKKSRVENEAEGSKDAAARATPNKRRTARKISNATQADLSASEQGTPNGVTNKRLVVKLRKKPPTSLEEESSGNHSWADGAKDSLDIEPAGKRSENNVWVRGAADFSDSESLSEPSGGYGGEDIDGMPLPDDDADFGNGNFEWSQHSAPHEDADFGDRNLDRSQFSGPHEDSDFGNGNLERSQFDAPHLQNTYPAPTKPLPGRTDPAYPNSNHAYPGGNADAGNEPTCSGSFSHPYSSDARARLSIDHINGHSPDSRPLATDYSSARPSHEVTRIVVVTALEAAPSEPTHPASSDYGPKPWSNPVQDPHRPPDLHPPPPQPMRYSPVALSTHNGSVSCHAAEIPCHQYSHSPVPSAPLEPAVSPPSVHPPHSQFATNHLPPEVMHGTNPAYHSDRWYARDQAPPHFRAGAAREQGSERYMPDAANVPRADALDEERAQHSEPGADQYRTDVLAALQAAGFF